jgi:hypothetical protein
MAIFFTALVPFESERRMPVARGRGWTAELKACRRHIRKCYGGGRKEVAITASGAETAQRALHLILNAHRLLHGAPPLIDEDDLIIDGSDRESPFGGGPILCSAIDFPAACHIAAKASRRRDHVYALALYRLSQILHSNAEMDFEPDLYPLKQRSSYPIDQARLAYAIVTAYAVVEQLGLAPLPQSFHKRSWIPEKRRDLERRLGVSGVDLSDRIVWQIRGGRTSIEIRSRRTNPRRAIWAFGQVRDVDIDVVDAIDDVRAIRSGIAAHRIDELVRLVSIHDVSNAQQLAKRLLLASLGVTAEWITELRRACR